MIDQITISFVIDERFKRFVVEKERSSPLTGIRITAGDAYLAGAPDHTVSTYARDFFQELLQYHLGERDPDPLDQPQLNRTVIEFANGPSWLLIDELENNQLRLHKCLHPEAIEDPSKRLHDDAVATVSAEAWAKEVVRAAREFHETVVDLNPTLRDEEQLANLRELITRVEQTFTFE